MNPVNFKLTGCDVRAPLAVTGNAGWLLYPCFAENHLLIRPGETVTVSCGVDFVSADNYVLTIHACPGGACLGSVSPLIIHPLVITGGETVAVRLTNASPTVCIIAKESFDYASKRGHGIFRSAVMIPYGLPIACGMPTFCGSTLATYRITETGAEGMCAL